jgi:hypothetical protein
LFPTIKVTGGKTEEWEIGCWKFAVDVNTHQRLNKESVHSLNVKVLNKIQHKTRVSIVAMRFKGRSIWKLENWFFMHPKKSGYLCVETFAFLRVQINEQARTCGYRYSKQCN